VVHVPKPAELTPHPELSRAAPAAPRAERRDRASAFPTSLNFKILLGYVLLGLVIFAVGQLTQGLPWFVAAFFACVASLLTGLGVSLSIARIHRLAYLNRSALQISRGDLSMAVTQQPSIGRDEIDELGVAIAQMQENLRELVSQIQRTAREVTDASSDLQSAAGGVNNSTDEVALSVDIIASGAVNQTELVERASKVIDRIAQLIQQTAGSAQEAQKTASETTQAAEFSAHAARLAGDKVKTVFDRIEVASTQVFAFGEKTQEITKFVDAITQVAQQTNLLALNATIEAARAGEAGRGFAVVAEEVRKLADSSSRQAEQISRLARDISAQSKGVVSAMKEGTTELGRGREDLNSILRSLEAIADRARRGNEKVTAISDAAKEQQKGSEEMVQVFARISQVARDHAQATDKVRAEIVEQTKAVAQMSSSTQELTNLSDELRTVLSRFKLGG
jgi:methyl-accepting chemotaxis protein